MFTSYAVHIGFIFLIGKSEKEKKSKKKTKYLQASSWLFDFYSSRYHNIIITADFKMVIENNHFK